MSPFSDIICLFLSEIIRSRRTTISRAAEISTLVLQNMGKIQTEEQLLQLLNQLEHDFEEVTALKDVLHFGHDNGEIKIYDHEIREFAANNFPHDAVSAAAFLQEAAQSGMVIQTLCLKYPDFCHFLIYNSDKSEAVNNLQLV